MEQSNKSSSRNGTLEHINRRQLIGGLSTGVAASIAGCLPNGDNDDRPRTPKQDRSSQIHILTDYTGEDTWEKRWKTIKQEWEAQDEASINVERAGFQGSGEERLSTLIQAGDAPEMFHGTLGQVGDLVANGQTLPVGDIIEDLIDSNGDMLVRETVSAEGVDRLLPHGVFLGGTFQYRTDIYKQLGLSVPKTMDELVENAKAIDEAEAGPAGKARGFALPATRAGKSASDFTNFLVNCGGAYWKWSNEEETKVELWFEEDAVTSALEYMDQLANYSPDPSNMNWRQTIANWVQGNVGQCFMNNAWLNGVAYANSSPVWRVTEQDLIPLKDRSIDYIHRGWALADGTPIIAPSNNIEGAKDLWRFMYEGADRQAEMNLVEPMRFLPPFEDVVNSDTYENGEIFQEEPSLLEKNKWLVDEIAPELGDNNASTMASDYAARFNINSELVSAVVVEGEDPSQAYQNAVEKFQTRLEEGRELVASNYGD